MPWDRIGLGRECDLAISAEFHASRRDRVDLGPVLDELRRRYEQRIGGKSAAYRQLFIRMTGHPRMDALLSAFDARLEAVLREDVDHWLDGSHWIVLWELTEAAVALRAAIEGEAAEVPAGPPVVGSQAKLLRHLRYRGGHYPGKLQALAKSGAIRLEEIPPAGGKVRRAWRMEVLSERAYNPNG